MAQNMLPPHENNTTICSDTLDTNVTMDNNKTTVCGPHQAPDSCTQKGALSTAPDCAVEAANTVTTLVETPNS